MRQRVGFARALAIEPEVLFMDEPFSALDVLTAENLRGELLDLWQSKKTRVRSIVVVTHSIEEAVMLADRIIVVGKNPAKIRADFRVSIEHPRIRTSADFALYVDYVYKLMTQPNLTAAPPAQAGARPAQMLPHARHGGIAGLLELVSDRGGKDDLYRLALDLRMNVDGLLPIVEAATLLGFAESARGVLNITQRGEIFIKAERATRKRLFRDAVIAHVPLLQRMSAAATKQSGRAPTLESFRNDLRRQFSEVDVNRQMETALNWGRYGELFNYDADTDRLS